MNVATRMSNPRAFLLLPFAVALLVLATVDGPILAAMEALGVEKGDAVNAAPFVSAAAAALGFFAFVAGLVGILRAHARSTRFGPYREALRTFAAEFGRGVDEVPEGLLVAAQRDGQRVEVRITGAGGGRVEIYSAPPARQSLAWIAVSQAPTGPAAGWREVDHGVGWRMRAELPVMARPLLADVALMEAVARFFARPEARAVTHTLAGMSIDAALPSTQDVEACVRAGTEIAFRLRRVNG